MLGMPQTKILIQPVDDEPERPDLADGEGTGGAIGLEIEFRGDGHDPLPSRRGNPWLAVERERDGGLGHASALRDVGDRRTFHPVLLPGALLR